MPGRSCPGTTSGSAGRPWSRPGPAPSGWGGRGGRRRGPRVVGGGVRGLGVLGFGGGALVAALGAVAGIYIVCDVAVSGWFAVSRSKWRAWPRLVAIFPSIHVAWALGFINRLIDGLDQDLVRPAEAP